MAEAVPSYGFIRLFVRHPTAANLLMAVMLLAGGFALLKLNTQFFPTIDTPSITVRVSWPGASAQDVEANILDAIEPTLRFLDGIEEATSIAREGNAVLTMEFAPGTDMQKAQSDVEQAVAGVTTLPEGSEEPVIRRHAWFERVANLSVSGPFSEAVVKAYAKQIRDGLLAAGIDKVDFNGLRDEEIWVRVRERNLRRHDLTLSDISRKIKENSRDLPSGTLEGDVELQLRALSEKRTPHRLGQIEVKSGKGGNKVLLRDISVIQRKFDKNSNVGLQQGQTAIELKIRRALTADTLKTLATLKKYLAEIRPTFPPTLRIEMYRVSGESVVKRLGILVWNGIYGLAIVLLMLFLFLDLRIAFWVAAGIPVALMATLAVMYGTGQTINMVSMFALIMMLGIIVDDAIVVGEHTATRQGLGDSRLEAAERGASRMLKPVLAATLTTQAAFLPILLIRDRIGDIMGALPLVVMAVLVASIIECFLILPGHLRHGFGKITRAPGRFRRGFDGALSRFRDGPFRRFSETAYNWRYTTFAFTIAMLIFSIGLIAGGRIHIRFFPSPEAERLSAYVFFGAGTPRADQIKAMKRIEDTLKLTEDKLVGRAGDSPSARREKLFVTSFTMIGIAGRSRSDNVAQMNVQLTASEDRETTSTAILREWRKHIPRIAGVERIALSKRRHGPSSKDLEVLLQGAPVDELKKVSLELQKALTGFPGVTGVSDDLPYGKKELIMEVTPRGAALGFTSENVGRQVRNAFEGDIATRFARGDEEITVRVKRVQEFSGLPALSQIHLRSPAGKRVPLLEVVSLTEKAGFSIIQRRDGKSTVSVSGEVDDKIIEVSQVVERLEREIMPELAAKYGVTYAFSGQAEERAKSFADLKLGAMLALALIYIILAWVFESYAKPLAVMSIIPFGIVGAILGHMALGYNLSIISLIGLLGLSGILVNDSIILVSQATRRFEDGQSLFEAAVGASQDRLRAVLLTSLTTIGGLTPLLFETSRQAQFLIPMAVTVVFGLAAATVLVLILVPALLGIGGDLAVIGARIKRFYFSRPETVQPGE